MRSSASAAGPAAPDKRVLAVLNLISSEFHKPLSRGYLARRVHLSESRLGALFRQTGLTVRQAVSYKRMEKAAELLATTDLLIKQIAVDVGVPDQGHFVRDFAKLYGFSPAAYRNHGLRKQGSQRDEASNVAPKR